MLTVRPPHHHFMRRKLCDHERKSSMLEAVIMNSNFTRIINVIFSRNHLTVCFTTFFPCFVATSLAISSLPSCHCPLDFIVVFRLRSGFVLNIITPLKVVSDEYFLTLLTFYSSHCVMALYEGSSHILLS